jgi:hypothetical protein
MPVRVPWMISSPEQFRTTIGADGQLAAITFIAFFRSESGGHHESNEPSITVVDEPPSFQPSGSDVGAPYRMVRVSFDRTVSWLMNDRNDFPEQDFDWSSMPVDPHRYRSLSELRSALDSYLFQTGLNPGPRMYEISGSAMIAALKLDEREYRHLVLIGEDQFYEIIAKSWSWEPGQPV